MTSGHIPCNLVVELLTDYLDGALDPVTAERVESHLVQCPPCVTYLDQLRTTIRQVGALPAGTLPESTVAALEAAFLDFHPPEVR